MRNIISFDKAIDFINDLELPSPTRQKLFISDALGFILAEDVKAKENSPAFKTSGMDGYAFCHDDFSKNSNEIKLKILGDNPAGSENCIKLEKNTCIKTFTGSLMPKGSDTLIPIENVEVQNNCILIKKEVPKGFAIRPIGENYKLDEMLIKKGTKISYAQVGVLASLNISQVLVYKKPLISIVGTGSEVLDLGETQTNHSQIRSSNHLAIEALAKNLGASTLQLGLVKDDIDSIKALFKDALNTSDILVTTGGVSVGDYDFVQDVIKNDLGAKVLFHGINMKPGMHVLLARKDNKIILALPGFAYSCVVCAILFLLPLIKQFSKEKLELKQIKAKMEVDFKKANKKRIFTACNVRYENGEYSLNFDGKKQGTSAILSNLLDNPALLIQYEEDEDLKAGDLVDAMLIDTIY